MDAQQRREQAARELIGAAEVSARRLAEQYAPFAAAFEAAMESACARIRADFAPLLELMNGDAARHRPGDPPW